MKFLPSTKRLESQSRNEKLYSRSFDFAQDRFRGDDNVMKGIYYG